MVLHINPWTLFYLTKSRLELSHKTQPEILNSSINQQVGGNFIAYIFLKFIYFLGLGGGWLVRSWILVINELLLRAL